MQQSKPYLDSWGNYIYYAVGSNKKYYILVAGEGNTPVAPRRSWLLDKSDAGEEKRGEGLRRALYLLCSRK